ncbi:uncharacterized protein LOC100882005 [Megachile rotundata]|uniref:uncharacterized protein LOC100882005 n=1 Tax=Megachile rotundata TaxID=143995 RepID=UPI000258E33A|nr:PREDICTED: uncharacterized protein LOC100882005 [Megachile rotundata]
MKDTSDTMKDDLSEDTMMDCEGDGGGGLDLTNDVADSSPTIRDAAERLLTLLGVDEENEDLMSSSEDEGVELDLDEPDDDEDEEDNARLLHQLVSLAKELKQQTHQKSSRIPARSSFKDSIDFMDTNCLERGRLPEPSFKGSCYRNSLPDKCQKQDSRFVSKDQGFLETRQCFDPCSRMTQQAEGGGPQVSGSWNAGWDACTAEALRYLVEDEGLHPHHPTVLAMKSHLELQRERAFFARYTA